MGGANYQADNATFILPPAGLRLKDEPGSTRAATVSAWLACRRHPLAISQAKPATRRVADGEGMNPRDGVRVRANAGDDEHQKRLTRPRSVATIVACGSRGSRRNTRGPASNAVPPGRCPAQPGGGTANWPLRSCLCSRRSQRYSREARARLSERPGRSRSRTAWLRRTAIVQNAVPITSRSAHHVENCLTDHRPGVSREHVHRRTPGDPAHGRGMRATDWTAAILLVGIYAGWSSGP